MRVLSRRSRSPHVVSASLKFPEQNTRFPRIFQDLPSIPALQFCRHVDGLE